MRKIIMFATISVVANGSMPLAADKIPEKFIQQTVTPAGQIQATRGIIRRVTPSIAPRFKLEIIPAVNGHDVFEVESSKNGTITLRGNSGVSLASAYHYYLKNYCHTMISWCGSQLSIPSPLPPVPQKIRKVCPHKYRVYFNYCTLNYTASWWDWQRWQREIDMMAMHGVNMPLSVIGLEGVWYYTLLDFGFSDAEAREYLVGPTYFAWQWMTNIQSHGGPLPKEWIDKHIILGRKILEAQRALGMHPIQQGFSGCVPVAMRSKFPDADIVMKSRWCGFPPTAQLDPLDPLFAKFGRRFLEREKELFGTSHIYAADPFHEGHPPKPGKEYLRKVGQAIYKLIDDFDPQCLWAMQAWSIRKDIACAVPKDHLLVLDLAGNRNDFWGYNYIKGQLHNFGGRINLHGDLNNILSNPFAKAAKQHDKCVGMGLFMEGIEQNPVFYEAVFDMIWRDSGVTPASWLQDYALRRYGHKSSPANKAWEILLRGPYRRGTGGVEASSIIAARPALHPAKSGPNAGFRIPYNPAELLRAWQLLLSDAEKLKASAGYRFDVVDIARQVLSNYGQVLQKEVTAAFESGNRKLFQQKSRQFIALLADVDRLLATTEVYRFGKWVNDARDWSNNPEIKDYYEWNASMLVTIWGPADNPGIFDYSWREWSGLIRLYYLPRWQKFFNYLDGVMAKGGTYSDPPKTCYGRCGLRGNDFYNGLADWELAWNKIRHPLPDKPQGDSITISKELLNKYAATISKAYATTATGHPAPQLAGTPIGQWTPTQAGTAWHKIKLNITKKLNDAGTYRITFRYTHGGCRLDIRSVRLLANGTTPVAQDIHNGTTGDINKNNSYTLKLKDFAFNTDYIIEAEIRSDGGNSSYGKIYLEKSVGF